MRKELYFDRRIKVGIQLFSYKNGNVLEAQVANVSSEDNEEWDHIDMNTGSDDELAIKHTSIYFTK